MHDFRVVGLLFLGFSRFLTPALYIAVCAEFFIFRRKFRKTESRVPLAALCWLQLLMPWSYYLIYPPMPGSTSETGFIHVSEKTLHAAATTGLLCSIIFFASLFIFIRAGAKSKTSPP